MRAAGEAQRYARNRLLEFIEEPHHDEFREELLQPRLDRTQALDHLIVAA
jgi:hypothetical protein